MSFTTIIYERLGWRRADHAEPAGARQRAEPGDARRDRRGARSRRKEDPQVRALIVQGAGAAFSSGFDLKEQMERRPSGVAQWEPILRKDFETVMRFWHLPKPTIAAVRGACLAGGFELALACDLTIAAEDAFFGEPELKFGAGIVVMLLPWLVGPKIAKEIILMGEDRLSAARAHAIGIVNRVVPAAELEAAALALARHLAAIDPSLVRRTKRAINRSLEARGMLGALEEALAIDLLIEGAGSPDKIRFMEIARRDGLKAALALARCPLPEETLLSGALAELLVAALRARARPRGGPGWRDLAKRRDLLALARRTADSARRQRRAAGRAGAPDDRQPARGSRRPARRLAGRRGRGAGASVGAGGRLGRASGARPARASRSMPARSPLIADAPPPTAGPAGRRRPRPVHLGQHGQAQGRGPGPRALRRQARRARPAAGPAPATMWSSCRCS